MAHCIPPNVRSWFGALSQRPQRLDRALTDSIATICRWTGAEDAARERVTAVADPRNMRAHSVVQRRTFEETRRYSRVSTDILDFFYLRDLSVDPRTKTDTHSDPRLGDPRMSCLSIRVFVWWSLVLMGMVLVSFLAREVLGFD